MGHTVSAAALRSYYFTQVRYAGRYYRGPGEVNRPFWNV